MVKHVVTDEALRLLHEGSECLSRIEAAGVRVNVDYLESTITKTQEAIKELENRMRADEVYKVWRKAFGDRTKLGGREQLATVLFDKMKYQPKEFTATGRAKADKDALDDIDLPFVRDFCQVENLKKTMGTYLFGIKREMLKHGKYHWYVHPIYNLHTTSTYRSSCDNPNFQNVPKRNPEMAKKIRPCYMPHPGHHMVEFDFSQLEVRVSVGYNLDQVLMKYVTDPTTDMHRDVAMQLFKIDPKEYAKHKDYFKKTVRDSAKNQFVFPEFYGSVFFNCAANIWKMMLRRDYRFGEKGRPMVEHLRDCGITGLGEKVSHWEGDQKGRIQTTAGTFIDHCRKVEEDFWQKRFRTYTLWKQRWFEKYQRDGGFSMFTGFAVNTVLSRNDVINYPIQGSAFHCLLWCLIMIDKWLRRYKMRSRIIGEIHDSMILSVHPAELQDVLNFCYKTMTKDLLKHWRWINVPLEAEADVGPVDGHWLETKEYHNEGGVWAMKS